MSYYYDHETDCVERRIDSDLSYNVEYNGGNMPGFRLEDVAYVLAALMGENDGPSYHWIIAMKDHTYAYVSGACDYTGWDCQSGGSAEILPSLREVLAAVEHNKASDKQGVDFRKLLTLQLTGENAFGESTPARVY